MWHVAHRGMYMVKSDVRRDVHSAAVLSTRCEIYNHIWCVKFGGLQMKENSAS